jgi:hypothetical protein
MAFNDLESKRNEREIAKFMEKRRPPPHIRAQLDFACTVKGHSVELVSIRPHWEDSSKITNSPIAKTTFVRSQNIWKVYWMRADLKWHGYTPNHTVHSLEAFFNVVDRDEYRCFFG